MKFFIPLILLLSILGCTKSSGPIALGSEREDDNVLVWQTNADGETVPKIINGEVVDPAKWKSVVNVKIGNSGCSATIVGPKAVVTAAHCGATTATFTLNNKDYTGKIERSGLYPSQDHDISVIILDSPIAKAEVGKFAAIGGTATIGGSIYLMGYGCTEPGGGAIDGKLRGGKSKITSFSGYDMVSSTSGGAALCFGDSGGPAFVDDNPDKPLLLGINSKGNIRDTNYNARTDSQESQNFLRSVVEKYSVEICGINGTTDTCGTDDPPIPPACDETKKKEILLGVAQCFSMTIIIPAN